jgi:ubiquinone/menaquinone biosynthesis C-methylase UbiE
MALDLLTLGGYVHFLKRAVEILAPQRGERILDLCSGTGRVVSWISPEVGKEGEVVGIDSASRMIEVSTSRYKGLENAFFLQKDVTESWEYENCFDGIFASFALHELPGSERMGVLRKAYVALRERGRMVIADFNPQVSRASKTISFTFFKLFERENLNFFSFHQREMFGKVGFKQIRTLLVLGGILQITLASKIS